MKSKRNKLVCIVLSVCISLTMFPIGCFAAHWSDEAVNTLNEIYGNNIFSTDETIPITKESMNTFLEKMNWATDVSLINTENLTRGEACEILADVFRLPIGDNSAIKYLYDQKIVCGYANGGLGENDDVTYAQFATLTYRILRTLGVGTGTQTQLQPETNDYFNYSYLKARNINIKKDEIVDNDVWNGWISRLKEIPNNGMKLENFSYDYPYEDSEISQLEAAKDMVDKYINEGGVNSVFSDVPLGHYCYDGVMYLLDKGIVNGYANGTYGPDDTINRITLAILLSRVKNTGNDDVNYCKQFAVENGYMMPDDSNANWWTDEATREEVIITVMKVTDVNVENVNPLVLERFKDKNTFSDNISPYIVYSVMLGIVNGTAEGYLNLDGYVTRGQLAVFLYRTELGVDTTKTQDYREIVNDILGTNQG